jgi:hypothetical protein
MGVRSSVGLGVARLIVGENGIYATHVSIHSTARNISHKVRAVSAGKLGPARSVGRPGAASEAAAYSFKKTCTLQQRTEFFKIARAQRLHRNRSRARHRNGVVALIESPCVSAHFVRLARSPCKSDGHRGPLKG